jgi:hypothetical protein
MEESKNLEQNSDNRYEKLDLSDVMVSLIGRKVKYNGIKYTVTDYFNYTDLIMLDDKITVSRIHCGVEWLI